MSLLLTLLVALAPTDWPKFRGPAADGHVTGPPVSLKWSDTENVKWKVPIPGLGWSSPTIVAGRVFLTTAVAEEQGISLRALALDAASGRVLWNREVRKIADVPAIHSKNSHASPTPIVDQGFVYVHFGALGMAKLQAENGDVIWLNTDLNYPPLHGSGGTRELYTWQRLTMTAGE